jgi:hypothetical protein
MCDVGKSSASRYFFSSFLFIFFGVHIPPQDEEGKKKKKKKLKYESSGNTEYSVCRRVNPFYPGRLLEWLMILSFNNIRDHWPDLLSKGFTSLNIFMSTTTIDSYSPFLFERRQILRDMETPEKERQAIPC